MKPTEGGRNILLSDVTLDAEEEKAVVEVLRSKWISAGPQSQAFEEEFGQFIGSDHVFAVSNGTAALHLAMLALGIGPGDEVIVPSLTFVASANSIRYTGATPVFADVSGMENWNISTAEVEKTITPKTRALLLVHYAGFPCEMTAFKSLAKKHSLYIVEDAAHAPGSWDEGRHLGTLGDAGCFSFFANKNLTTGEGGAISVKDPDLADKIRHLRSHGMSSLSWDRYKGHAYQYDVVSLGFNYRFDELRAAIGRVQLKKLPESNAAHSRLYKSYMSRFSNSGAIEIPFKNAVGRLSHHLFPILLPEGTDRLALMKTLRECGIQTSIHYPPAHQFSIYKDNTHPLPITEAIGKRELTLPLHPLLSENDISYIAEKLTQSL